MYTPSLFEMHDARAIAALLAAHPFALLLTQHGGELHATHLPFHFDAAAGPRGRLEAHLARANAHCAAIEAGAASTVVFSGPNAYVSPRWYADPARNVPTWNYVAVHLHGRPRPLRDAAAVLRIIGTLTDAHEAGNARPWSIRDAQAHAEPLVRGVLAFEMDVERIEGKSKLSQNRSEPDRAGVMNALRARGDASSVEMLRLMEALYTPEGALR